MDVIHLGHLQHPPFGDLEAYKTVIVVRKLYGRRFALRDLQPGFNAEEGQLVSTIIANQRVYDSISDMIMDSWAQRSTSYDIISQKQSDATLGYERVYDVETNEIYRAYNGFTDDYTGDRYQPVTDDMYSLGIDGYIDK